MINYWWKKIIPKECCFNLSHCISVSWMCIVAVQVKSEPVAQLEIMQLCSTNRKKRGLHPCFSQLLERYGEFVAAKGCKRWYMTIRGPYCKLLLVIDFPSLVFHFSLLFYFSLALTYSDHGLLWEERKTLRNPCWWLGIYIIVMTGRSVQIIKC